MIYEDYELILVITRENGFVKANCSILYMHLNSKNIKWDRVIPIVTLFYSFSVKRISFWIDHCTYRYVHRYVKQKTKCV